MNIIKNTKKSSEKKCERYQNLSKEEKGKRRKNVRDRYKNLPEEKKQETTPLYEKILLNK